MYNYGVTCHLDRSMDGVETVPPKRPFAEKRGTYFGAKEAKRNKVIVGVPANGGQPWRGTIDELTVWDRPLSDEEIANFAITIK